MSLALNAESVPSPPSTGHQRTQKYKRPEKPMDQDRLSSAMQSIQSSIHNNYEHDDVAPFASRQVPTPPPSLSLPPSPLPLAPYLYSGQQPQQQQQQQQTTLETKLDYMIQLLEQSQDEKTNNITEEVVLYSFLGIFIIFIVDSFVRVGKYIR